MSNNKLPDWAIGLTEARAAHEAAEAQKEAEIRAAKAALDAEKQAYVRDLFAPFFSDLGISADGWVYEVQTEYKSRDYRDQRNNFTATKDGIRFEFEFNKFAITLEGAFARQWHVDQVAVPMPASVKGEIAAAIADLWQAQQTAMKFSKAAYPHQATDSSEDFWLEGLRFQTEDECAATLRKWGNTDGPIWLLKWRYEVMRYVLGFNLRETEEMRQQIEACMNAQLDALTALPTPSDLGKLPDSDEPRIIAYKDVDAVKALHTITGIELTHLQAADLLAILTGEDEPLADDRALRTAITALVKEWASDNHATADAPADDDDSDIDDLDDMAADDAAVFEAALDYSDELEACKIVASKLEALYPGIAAYGSNVIEAALLAEDDDEKTYSLLIMLEAFRSITTAEQRRQTPTLSNNPANPFDGNYTYTDDDAAAAMSRLIGLDVDSSVAGEILSILTGEDDLDPADSYRKRLVTAFVTGWMYPPAQFIE